VAPRDGLLGASRLALRVALAGDRRRCAASSNRLVYVGGSNCDQMALGANPGYFQFFMGLAPRDGTEIGEKTPRILEFFDFHSLEIPPKKHPF
jgi:hypothetical protein